jgi:hypothetical protein
MIIRADFDSKFEQNFGGKTSPLDDLEFVPLADL